MNKSTKSSDDDDSIATEVQNLSTSYRTLCNLLNQKIGQDGTSEEELLSFVLQTEDVAKKLKHYGQRNKANKLFELRMEVFKMINASASKVKGKTIAELRLEGYFPEAKNALGRVVEETTIASTDAESVAKVRLSLANTYRADGDFLSAKANYLEAMENLNEEEKAEACRQLGTIHRNEGDYIEAKKYFQEANTCLENGSHHMDKAAVYNDLATMSWRQGNLDETTTHIESSMAELESLGLDNLMHQLDELEVFRNPVDADTSMAEAFQDIEIAIENEGKTDLVKSLGKTGVVPNLFNMRGLLELDSFNFEEAAVCFKKSYAIRKLEHGEAPVVAYAWMNFGKMFDTRGMYQQSLACYEKAHAIFAARLSANHALLGEMRNTQGNILQKQNHTERSAVCYMEALGIAKKAFGEDSSLAQAVTQNNMGIQFMQEKDYEVAEDNFALSFKIYSTFLAKGVERERGWINFGAIEAKETESNFLLESLRTSSEQLHWLSKIGDTSAMVYETSIGRDTPSFACLLNNMGNMMARAGLNSLADLHYRKSLAIKNATLHENHPSLAVTKYNMNVTSDGNAPERIVVV